jgi:tetratricopeptide (TPR) repeat protein
MSGQLQRNIWRLALAAGMVIIGFMFNLSLAELPFTPSDRSVSAYWIEPSPAVVDRAATDAVADQIQAAKSALRSKQFSQALMLFEELLAADPALINEISGAYVETLLGMALDLMPTDPGAARAHLSKALEVDAANISVLSQIGYIYVSQNDYPQAIETYQKVAELDPGLPDSFFNLGYIYAVTENYSKAEEMYSRVVELAPDFLDEALFNLAMVQYQLGARRNCIQSLKQAIEINPANESAATYLKQILEEKE